MRGEEGGGRGALELERRIAPFAAGGTTLSGKSRAKLEEPVLAPFVLLFLGSGSAIVLNAFALD